MKPDSLIKQGLWYCNEKCAPSLEEVLIEEQRKMAKLIKEGGVISDIKQVVTQHKDEVYQEENLYDGGEIDIDLNKYINKSIKQR